MPTYRPIPLCLAALVAAACGLGMAPRAAAQIQGSMSFGAASPETFRPLLTKGEIEVMSRLLKLAPEDRASVAALFEAHDLEVRSEGSKVRARCREWSEEAELFQRHELQRKIAPELASWEKRKQSLEKQFLDDLTTMLTKEQEAMWPLVEREIRRPRQLATSWMSGEGVDVVALLASVDPGASENVKVVELLERYAAEVDTALKERDAFVKANAEEAGETVRTDPKRALFLRQTSVRNRVKVREINKRYVNQLAAELSEPSRSRFLDEYLTKCVLWLNRETHAERYIKSAIALQDIDPSKRSDLESISREYSKAVIEITRRTVNEYQAYEETRIPRRLRIALGLEAETEQHVNDVADAPEGTPLAKVRRERLALDRKFRSRVDALLSAEQQALIEDQGDVETRFSSLNDDNQL